VRSIRGRLRLRRERLGLTQADVAARAGFSSNHVGVVEGSGNCSDAAVFVVSAALAGYELGLGLFEHEVADVRVDQLEA
jgi:transcriptional regulator with XRE-family HTH domain